MNSTTVISPPNGTNTHEAQKIKQPDVAHDIHPLIQKRWSPRSFSGQTISEEQLDELFEAARWSASANNEQPWLYIYAFRGTPEFEQLWNCLLPGNQPWTKQAAVLMVALARKTFAKTGKPNPWAIHDLGMANAQLFLQAAHRNIYGHMMAGFDKTKTASLLTLDDDVEPICMAALGYLGEVEALQEPYKSRELSRRERLPVKQFTRNFQTTS
ncbi:MAG: nitroreductase family protein [Bacteroidota bacterium]